MLTCGIPPDFRGCVHVFTPPSAVGSVPSLSGHAIAYPWCSLPRVRRHRASSPQDSSSNGCFFLRCYYGPINVRLPFPTLTTSIGMKWACAIQKVSINRERLTVLLVVSWTGKMNISLSLFAPESLILARRVWPSRPASVCPFSTISIHVCMYGQHFQQSMNHRVWLPILLVVKLNRKK